MIKNNKENKVTSAIFKALIKTQKVSQKNNYQKFKI